MKSRDLTHSEMREILGGDAYAHLRPVETTGIILIGFTPIGDKRRYDYSAIKPDDKAESLFPVSRPESLP